MIKKELIVKQLMLDSKHSVRLDIEKTTARSTTTFSTEIMYDIFAHTNFKAPGNTFLNDASLIGFALLSVTPSHKEAVLRNIKVTNPDYMNKGIGSALLRTIEELCIENGCERIEGLFRPSPNEHVNAKQIEAFYRKHGYILYYDDERDFGWTIAKNLLKKTNEHDDTLEM